MSVRSFYIALLCMAVVNGSSLMGQNLVPNGSFEDYTSCPDEWSQLAGNVVGWDACANSPDFFHGCRDSSDLGVPFNWRGYQQAAHGQGYGGVITYQWNAPSYREFICTNLAQALVPGVPVHLSMKVALGGFGSYWLYSPKWTTRGIGMLLTTQPFEWSTGSAYPNVAHLFMDTVFTDTTAWVLLSTTYVPDSVYQYVTLGNFFEDSLSALTLLDSVFGNQNVAYVYIDEICVTAAGSDCDFANAVATRSFASWAITSPFNDRLVITFGRTLEQETELILFDTGGRRLAHRTIPPGSSVLEWPIHGLASGIYVVHCLDIEQGPASLRVFHVSP